MLKEKDKIVTEEKELANNLNDHYINIAELSRGTNQPTLQKNRKLKTTQKQ